MADELPDLDDALLRWLETSVMAVIAFYRAAGETAMRDAQERKKMRGQPTKDPGW